MNLPLEFTPVFYGPKHSQIPNWNLLGHANPSSFPVVVQTLFAWSSEQPRFSYQSPLLLKAVIWFWHWVSQVGLKLSVPEEGGPCASGPQASISWVLGLQVCAIPPSFPWHQRTNPELCAYPASILPTGLHLQPQGCLKSELSSPDDKNWYFCVPSTYCHWSFL